MGARSSQSRGPGVNETDGHLLEYFRNTFGGGGGGTTFIQPPPSGITATGGVISDYTTTPGDVYRAHVFASSGTFDVSALSIGAFPDNVEYLVVAGGGGGGAEGSQRGGGGGAGGYRTNVPAPVGPGSHTTSATLTVSVAPYTVTVGSGGAGGAGGQGTNGNDSVFGSIVSNGGGGGGQGSQNSPPANEGRDGGSGGGGGSTAGGSYVEPGGATTAVTTPSPWPGPSTQGFAGGQGEHSAGSWAAGGGGGGAGEVGKAGSPPNSTSSHGGDGLSNLIAGPLNTGVGVVNPASPGRWFAGGGAGIHFSPGTGTGGAGGGGSTSYPGEGDGGVPGTGGGGASGSTGGSGGSGIVIVRYQIASVATKKASGGSISFSGGKTVHVFTNSGIFTVNNGPITCDYLVVGGGASGGIGCGGGGGAGGYRTSLPEGPGGPSPSAESTQAIANGPYAVTVGGGGASAGNGSVRQTIGNAGTFSNIAFPSAIRAEGGGGGGNVGGSGQDGQPGGSGGGGTYPSGTQSSGNKQSPHSGTPAPNQGYGGGASNPPANYGAGGGGGAGGVGANGTSSDGGDGGTGKQNTVTGVTLSLAGGGGGNIYYPSSTVGDATHGGGQGAPHAGVAPESGPTSIHGHSSTGGGGGGGLRANGPGPATGIPPGLPSSTIAIAGQGGSGIVIIAYPT